MTREQVNTVTQKRILLIIVVLFWFSQYVYIPYQTPYLISIGVVTSFIGIIVGAYGFSQLILRMPVGLMADIRGKHKVFIIIGTTFSGLASIFRILVPNGTGFLMGSLFSGLASAMWISFMVLYSNYFENEELQKSTGLIIGANNLGILMGFITGTLFYDTLGMKFLCILSLVIAIPSTILAFFIKEPPINFKPLSVRQLASVYVDKRLIIFSLIALIQQGVLMSTCMSFTTQVAKTLGGSGFQIGMISIIYITSAVASSYFSASRVATKKGAKFWIPITLICICAYCIIIPNVPSMEYIYFAQILAGMGNGIIFSFCTSEAMKNVSADRKSTAMGYFQAIYAIGMTIIPMITGLIDNCYNMNIAYYFLASMTGIGFLIAICFYGFKDQREKYDL